MVLTCPQFGHGEYFAISGVPQLPQKPRGFGVCILPGEGETFCGVPHEGHVVEPGETTAPQLVQSINLFCCHANKIIVLEQS